MVNREIAVSGVIVRGHGVASGTSADSPYPRGSIERQTPFFRERGLDLGPFYPGTLNISIAPRRFRMVRPGITFRQVAWTSLVPPEDFSFSACRIIFQGVDYKGLVYYPHPETKIQHHQDDSVLEILAPWIEMIGYGDAVELLLDVRAIKITG